MTTAITKALALGGLCALVLGGNAASAQGYGSRYHARHHARHHAPQRARRHLQVLHAVYSHEIKSGHPAAAMKAHLQAKAIRARLRARHGG